MDVALERRLVLVEFWGNKPPYNRYPFNVQTLELEQHPWDPRRRAWSFSIYDAAYCRRDKRVLYHCSGGGGTGGTETPEVHLEHPESFDYWIAPSAVLWNHGVRARRILRLSPQLERKILDGIENDQVDELVECSVCQDFYSGADAEDVCEHVWWCERCVDWAGPGAASGVVGCRHRIIEPWDEDELDEDMEMTHL